MKSFKIIYFLPLLVIIFDQLSKFWVQKFYPDLILINTQGVLGILPAWVAILGLIGLIVLVYQQKKHYFVFSIILVAGLSNIWDRFIHGGVIDFIHIWRLPVFNLADLVIDLGIIYLVYMELIHPPSQKKNDLKNK